MNTSHISRARASLHAVGLTAFSFVAIATPCVAPAAQSYAVTDLGTLDARHSYSYGFAVNNSGEVVGYSANGLPLPIEQRAYRWSASSGMVGLGTLDDEHSQALGINDAGQAVGYTWSDRGWATAFVDDDQGMRRLDLPGTTYSIGFGINDAGMIVGSRDVWGLLYDHGHVADLGTIGQPNDVAYAINDLGHVVGSAFTGKFTMGDHGSLIAHAFLYDGNRMVDLGTLGGTMSAATGINDRGDVVGWSDTSQLDAQGNFIRHAFLYQNGAMIDLGSLGPSYSAAFAINEHGQIVGHYADDQGYFHAFLYRDGRMLDLESLVEQPTKWGIPWARDINDFGQIVGDRAGPAGYHAVLLTPVPEASTLALAVCACAFVVLTRSVAKHVVMFF